MQLFDFISPRLFRPLAGPNRAFYAELLQHIWESCRHSADYSLPRSEMVGLAEDYFEALAKPLTLDTDFEETDGGAEGTFATDFEQLAELGALPAAPTRDAHVLALAFLLRLRRTGWLTEQEGSYEAEPRLAVEHQAAPLLNAMEQITNPQVVTYSGKLYKAWQLLKTVGAEKSPYENVLREISGDMDVLNTSLRQLNASIGSYIDRLTRNKTPQQVLELFSQYEEQIVAAAYHRFKTSDNLFNYRAFLQEGLDDCETKYFDAIAADYRRVEQTAPGQAAPAVRALIQKLRDDLDEMSSLIRIIDESHIHYRRRAVQRAQFLLLSDRSAQGRLNELLRRYAESISSPADLFETDDGPVGQGVCLYPAEVFGEKPLCTPAAPRKSTPIAALSTPEPISQEELRREQELLLQYARMAVTEENVNLFAVRALAGHAEVRAAALVGQYPDDFTKIIGLHTYSQSPQREYELTLSGTWAERGGFRFEDFTVTKKG